MIDKKQLAKELRFDEADVDILLSAFIESSQESLQNIKESIKTSDSKTVQVEAHAIKSSAGNLRLVGIQKMAYIIEEATKNNLKLDYDLVIKKIDRELKSIKEIC
jgi:HPt (histidine-containing phosphotransfer) domain-containing protein